MNTSRNRATIWLAAILLLSPVWLSAQATTGNIFGTVLDEQGAPLPGATVMLSGVDAPRTYVTTSLGEFRFPALGIGTYRVEASLEGFSTVEYPSVIVNAGRNTTIDVTLSSAVEDVITVTAESPLLDERKISAGAAIANIELEKIPTARDPWSLLSMTPGVQVDRINVGGNESGQQSAYVSAGSNTDDTTWQVDGVNITDMTSISSPSYFDFDAFEEVQYVTGGSDVSIESAGVTVNIVTKRGTNEWRGTGRYILTDGEWQSDPDLSSGDFGRNNNGAGGATLSQNPATYIPNSINEVKETGLSVGGPILKDRLWIWGAYGKSDPIDNIVGSTGQHDITILENLNGKFSAQIVPSNSANVQYSENDKIKNGRGAGANRAPETTTDQSGVGGAPSDITKIEDTQIFGSNFYLTGMYSFVDGGFQLVPKGGVDANVFMLDDGVYRGSYYFLFNNRDVTQYKGDASLFFQTGSASNELKFGASTRLSEVASNFGYAGNFWVYDCAVFGCSDELGPATRGVDIKRDANSLDESTFQAAWIQDTITLGNLTLNAGVRYERSTGEVLAATIPGVSRGGVSFLPGLSTTGFDPSIEFSEILPRLGVTYALGQERKTLVRGSLSTFSELYITGNHTRLSSTGANGRLNCLFTDLDNDYVVDPNEAASVSSCIPISFNPASPNNSRTPNATDPNLEPSKTLELLLSVEHSLLPEFVVSAGLLYRNISNMTELRPFVRENGVTRSIQPGDYIPASSVVNGQTVNYFVRRPGVTLPGGSLLTNGDREQNALGLTLGFNKRLSNRWMARGHFQYTDWEWDIPSSYFDHVDPTNFGDGAGIAATGDRDGEVVAERSGGSGNKGGIFLNAKWSASFTGLYQVAPDQPWGFNVGGAISAREGYPSPVFANVRGSDGSLRAVQVSRSVDGARNDDVYTIDLRLDKEITFNDFALTLGLDVFNALNDNTVLQRERSFTATRFDFINETISPRILRAGVRLSFR